MAEASVMAPALTAEVKDRLRELLVAEAAARLGLKRKQIDEIPGMEQEAA